MNNMVPIFLTGLLPNPQISGGEVYQDGVGGKTASFQQMLIGIVALSGSLGFSSLGASNDPFCLGGNTIAPRSEGDTITSQPPDEAKVLEFSCPFTVFERPDGYPTHLFRITGARGYPVEGQQTSGVTEAPEVSSIITANESGKSDGVPFVFTLPPLDHLPDRAPVVLLTGFSSPKQEEGKGSLGKTSLSVYVPTVSLSSSPGEPQSSSPSIPLHGERLNPPPMGRVSVEIRGSYQETGRGVWTKAEALNHIPQGIGSDSASGAHPVEGNTPELIALLPAPVIRGVHLSKDDPRGAGVDSTPDKGEGLDGKYHPAQEGKTPSRVLALLPRSPMGEKVFREETPFLHEEGRTDQRVDVSHFIKGQPFLRMVGAKPLLSSPQVVEGAQIVQQIVQKIQVMSHEGRKEMEVRLKPDHLGVMRVRLVAEDGRITVRLGVESTEVRHLIESHLEQLRFSLTRQGLEIRELNVFVESQLSDPQGKGVDSGTRRGKGSHLGGTPIVAHPLEDDQRQETSFLNLGYNTVEWIG